MPSADDELRAHTQALNALREVQLEQDREMREGFSTLATGTAQITATHESRRIGGARIAAQSPAGR
ncbi:MAG: hypothetical protein ACRDTA_30245 [Pseudonocardiaceae bacterium]